MFLVKLVLFKVLKFLPILWVLRSYPVGSLCMAPSQGKLWIRWETFWSPGTSPPYCSQPSPLPWEMQTAWTGTSRLSEGRDEKGDGQVSNWFIVVIQAPTRLMSFRLKMHTFWCVFAFRPHLKRPKTPMKTEAFKNVSKAKWNVSKTAPFSKKTVAKYGGFWKRWRKKRHFLSCLSAFLCVF